MKQAVIVSAVRTPVGKKGGTLKNFTKSELAGLTVREALNRASLDGKDVDEVIFGSVTGVEYRNLARHIWLEAGLPISVPAITVNRACATSLTGLVTAAALIRGGLAERCLVGGVEMDSKITYLLSNENPYNAGAPQLWRGYSAPLSYGNPDMIQTADNVAKRYGISREDCDAFALRSHRLAALGYDEGLYQEHILPVSISDKKGNTVIFERDETIRNTSAESLAKLRPIYQGGVTTAGNSSPLNDGSSAAVIMEESAAKACGHRSYMRMVDAVSVGVDPNYMGLGPAEAVPLLLKRNGMTLSDIDFIEMNEAFAAQSVAVSRILDIDSDKLNPRGGAIALGHPYAATGINLVAKAASLMKRRCSERCIVTFCVGGGQGVAVLFENCAF